MKLVDLLIKHNVQWPAGATFVWQGVSHVVYWYGPGESWSTHLAELSDRDLQGYRCTKEQYDAALAKHNSKWVRHRGSNKCPILPNRAYQVRFRDGSVGTSDIASNDASLCIWRHHGATWDIMAWRYV